MTRTSAETLLVSPDLVLGRSGNLSIAIWRSKPTAAGAAALDRHFRSMSTTHPDGFGSLIIIEEQTANPDEAMRRAITDTMDRAAEELLSVAVVLEAKGFAAAALRAALTGMSMMTRSRFPRRFVSSVEEALPWLVKGLTTDSGRALTPVELSQLVADFRSSLPPRAEATP